jgi:ABC-type dipeptide/oligopeptide/nickel transport system permease component
MLGYVIRRLAEMVTVLLGVSVLVFLMIHMIPGDPARIIAGLESSPETVEQIRRELGLDQPLHVQFWMFLKGVSRGDLGMSYRTNTPVSLEIAERFPYTFAIAVGGAVLATMMGIFSGILAAVFHNRIWDGLIMAVSLMAISTPSYWLALMLMLVFSLSLGLLPSIGVRTPLHYVLPIITLGAQSGGMIARMTRSAMLDVLRQDYISAARSRGQTERVVILKHALRNASIPVVSIVGLRFGGLLAGTVLVESVFGIPGVGRLVVDAVIVRDYPMIQGSILVVASSFVFINALTDILYGVIDPRIRLG